MVESSADGFVAYTDGENYYNAGDKITVNSDLSFETISIGRVSMLKGAQFRLGKKNGIRFLTTVDVEKLESVATKYGATIQKGTIIAPRDSVSGDFVYSSKVAAVIYDSDIYYAENTFVGSIVNIKESNAYNQESGNIAREFVGRGYVKVTIGDFEKIIYASYNNSNIKNNTRSLAQLAYCLQNDTENAELYEEFKTMVDKWAAFYKGADYNALFDLNAKEYLSNIRVGINTGRSLDCMTNKSGDTYTVEDLKAQEQKYDFINPTDVELIRSFKAQGFNAVRMPVTWSEAIGPGPDYIVSDILMYRVQEVVDMILAEDMYCILNSHNEFNWLYTRNSDLDGMHAKFKALWKQIAERFKDYDGRLIFEGYNEVLKLPEDWTEKSASDYAQVNLLAQEFVDTVRATGGNNEKRFLVVAPYGAGCYEENLSMFAMPTDTAKDKLIVDVHYYFPHQALLGDGSAFVFEEAKAELDAAFDLIQTSLVDKGYAIMINEEVLLHFQAQ